MSIALMSRVWSLPLPSTPKLVLLSLADQANDAGYCWPSIATICTRTSLGKTTVLENMRWLEEGRFLTVHRRAGVNNTYTLTVEAGIAQLETSPAAEPVREPHQSANRTGPVGAPVRQVNQSASRTGPAAAPTRPPSEPVPVRLPDPNRHITVIEPPEKKKTRARKALEHVPRPDDVPEQLWSDYLKVREAKKAVLTETALAGLRNEAGKAGMSLAEVLAECCQRNWIGFKQAWIARDATPRGGPTPAWVQERDRREAGLAAVMQGIRGEEGTDDERTIDADIREVGGLDG